MHTTYENAPSTKLLATHCASCGRPLRDAASVEAGMGPDCREKHGYENAQGPADWLRGVAYLGSLGLFGSHLPLTACWGVDARRACNILVHHAACAPRGERAPFVQAIEALGFVRLARALARGAGEVVEVQREAGSLVVRTPYSLDFAGSLKSQRIGARWDREAKAWRVPDDARARTGLYDSLRAHFAGALLVSARGIATIPARVAQKGAA